MIGCLLLNKKTDKASPKRRALGIWYDVAYASKLWYRVRPPFCSSDDISSILHIKKDRPHVGATDGLCAMFRMGEVIRMGEGIRG